VTDVQSEEKLIVGALIGLAIAAFPAYLPKSAPVWVWDTFRAAFVVVLMIAAATAAVAWERYGPNGYKLREAALEEALAQFNAARADFDSAVAGFKSARAAAAEARFNDQDTSETQQDGE
jgi:hypothetical protein